jgi:hypothetical protein
MNSIHRIGVTIAGLATVVTVAGAFVAQGYVAAQQAAAEATAQATAANPTANPTMDLAPQTIYINPLPTPPVVTVTAPPANKPPVIHVVVPAPAGGDDEGSDG